MTAATETVSSPAVKKPGGQTSASKYTSLAVGIVASIAISAMVSGLAGIALNKGWGIHVPFTAGTMAVYAFLLFTRSVAMGAAHAWYHKAVEAAPQLAAAAYAGQYVAQLEVTRRTDLVGTLSRLANLAADDS